MVHLEKKLKENGVQLNPIPEERVFERLNDIGLVKPITGLLADFLTLYKSNDITKEELRQRAKRSGTPERANAFVEVFTRVFDEYEKYLASQEEIDFEDMIINATEYVRAGKVKLYYRYILVDEFQDISQIRHKLLRAILDLTPDSKLFAVGDDWQSIFRFAGSDLNVMTQFDKYYGESELLIIDENSGSTTRYATSPVGSSLRIHLRYESSLSRKKVIMQPAISLVYTRNPQEGVKKILSHLNQESGSVYILGRYKSKSRQFPTIPVCRLRSTQPTSPKEARRTM